MDVLPCKCLGKCKQGPALRLRLPGQRPLPVATNVAPAAVAPLLSRLLADAKAGADGRMAGVTVATPLTPPAIVLC